MEDKNKLNQENSELDISCCFSSKFLLPTSLFEDEDEIYFQENNFSPKSGCNDPQKKYSSSTCNTAFSNNSCRPFNGSLGGGNLTSELFYLNRDKNPFRTEDMSNNPIEAKNPNIRKYPMQDYQRVNQRHKTFSYNGIKNADLLDLNYENFNHNHFSPQIYPSNLQGMQIGNAISQRINNVNFANYCRNNKINNNMDKFGNKMGNVQIPWNLIRNQNEPSAQNNFNNQINQNGFAQQINQNFQAPFGLNSKNFNKNTYNNYTNNINNNNASTFPYKTSIKNNFSNELPHDMAKLNITNLGNQAELNNHSGTNRNVQPGVNPYVIRNSQRSLTQMNLKGPAQSLTPVLNPELCKRKERRINSHKQNKLIPAIIHEDPLENDFISSDESLHVFLKSVDGNLVHFLKTQKGSRIMQKFMISNIPPDCVELLFAKIFPQAIELMTDNYGNYFMQRLIQSCSCNQKMLLLKKVFYEFLDVACNASGTHSIQAIIETISTQAEEKLIRECVENNMLVLCRNANGTHIIQKIILCIAEEKRKYLNDFIVENINHLAMNVNGVCVVKKFMNLNKNYNIRDCLVRNLERDCLEILKDPYGNYAIQYALEYYGISVCVNIINTVVANIVLLSNQKFSSNVVEKCIESGSESLFRVIVVEMFLNCQNFLAIMKNKYGNFVLVKAIKTMSIDFKNEVKNYLLKNVIINCGKERIKFNCIIDLFC